jgi:SAM-dependent methyltransferase
MIRYNHSQNIHTKNAPRAIIPIILDKYSVNSILDVGCGTGVWLEEFNKRGLEDLYGIDGIDITAREYTGNPALFQCIDLSEPWNLGRSFDLVISLEVGEHIPDKYASSFLDSICTHTDKVIFSAACPHQDGQGHVNCQWPEYWQLLFNERGFACKDHIRPLIWNYDFPEFWYKQNIFSAERDPALAGMEARIAPFVHPDMLEIWTNKCEYQNKVLSGNNGLKNTLRQALGMSKSAFSKSLRRLSTGKLDTCQTYM